MSKLTNTTYNIYKIMIDKEETNKSLKIKEVQEDIIKDSYWLKTNLEEINSINYHLTEIDNLVNANHKLYKLLEEETKD